jgi:cyclase
VNESISSSSVSTRAFEVIPSIDILDGEVVRLLRGSYGDVTRYGAAERIVASWGAPAGTRIHVVDLEGARSGAFTLDALVASLATRYEIQVGGGIRRAADVERAIVAGASRVVVGTMAVRDPLELRRAVDCVGASRLVVALDLLDGEIRVAGWTSAHAARLDDVLRDLEAAGIGELLVTDVSRDGAMTGPAFDLYRELAARTSMRILASGGVARLDDVTMLARSGCASGVIVGRALQERVFTCSDAREAAGRRPLPARIIPCLDVRGGRVVKGVRFRAIRDAGDVVECSRRYEAEGADEIVLLDISATAEEREASLETVRRVADQLFIPLTVGGGVKSVDDFRRLLRAGADRVAINSAAVDDPSLIERCAGEFGVQAVVVACDAKRRDNGWEVMTRAGSSATGLDAVDWARRAASLGAGEILLTSIDRDGTQSGFDCELTRAVTGATGIGVIASGGAGRLEHFREAIESGGASAVLAASLFHDGVMSIGELKTFLEGSGIGVRR